MNQGQEREKERDREHKKKKAKERSKERKDGRKDKGQNQREGEGEGRRGPSSSEGVSPWHLGGLGTKKVSTLNQQPWSSCLCPDESGDPSFRRTMGRGVPVYISHWVSFLKPCVPHPWEGSPALPGRTQLDH